MAADKKAIMKEKRVIKLNIYHKNEPIQRNTARDTRLKYVIRAGKIYTQNPAEYSSVKLIAILMFLKGIRNM
ncbi:MAG: hypothetical protein ACOZDD_02855 [Bacteroidota bacterium]